MVEIKAGAELDRAVAEAIGLKATHRLSSGSFLFTHPRSGVGAVHSAFRPSTDLNDAFYAAEAVGLFDQWHIGKWSNPPQSGWGIEGDDSPVSGLYQTPSLAICAAILELAKGNES